TSSWTPAPAVPAAIAAAASAAMTARRIIARLAPFGRPSRHSVTGGGTAPRLERIRGHDEAVRRLLACLALVLVATPGAQAARNPFVTRAGAHLELGGRPFRFGGANVEWLGLVGYGPADPAGPRPPSHFEIDDALTTARLLGANVVRSQTLVDSVGCSACIEPALGQFDESAFASSDYALAT